MDPQTDRADQDQAPPDQTTDAEERSGASPPPREPASHGLMNRFLRGLGFGGRDDDASDDAATETTDAPPPSESGSAAHAADPAPAQEPDRLTMTADEFRRAVQSAKDRELVGERRQHALAQAEAGDLQPIRALAERGDAWANHQLAERGDTWFLGEQRERELKEQAARAADPMPAIAASFDQTVIWPILGAIAKEEEVRIVGTGIVGMDGRQRAVEDALAVHAREAVTKALTDEQFASDLLGSEAFRAALYKHPAVAKRVNAIRRGEPGEEGDLLPAAGGSRRRENDFMNDLLRYGSTAARDQDDE